MSDEQKAIGEVWATVLLDVRADNSINLDAIETQVRYYSKSGLDGVYCNGTACEFHNQSDAEFQQVSKNTAEAARKFGLAYQLSAAHPSPQTALRRVEELVALRPAAIQVVLPDWTTIDLVSASRFLKACAERAHSTPLVLYNPPHAKTVLSPAELTWLCHEVPQITGIKCGDGATKWYQDMQPVMANVSVFVPGHNYCAGVLRGAAGSYSNMACLSPKLAAKWRDLVYSDRTAAQDLQVRISNFIKDAFSEAIGSGTPGFVCDKAMAVAAGWSDISKNLLWPFDRVASDLIENVKHAANRHIPEFLSEG